MSKKIFLLGILRILINLNKLIYIFEILVPVHPAGGLISMGGLSEGTNHAFSHTACEPVFLINRFNKNNINCPRVLFFP